MKHSATRSYEFYKAKWDNTKPIRGRAEDVRPIGNRKRTHELVTQKKLLSGEVSYCAVMHGTEVVEYHNNGDITLRTGGWATPLTAEYMYTHSPFGAWKQAGKIWVKVPHAGSVHPDSKLFVDKEHKFIPIDRELTLRYVGDECYEVVGKKTITKEVVDRAKAKEARQCVQPFLTWAKAFLKMSDGWIMHETRRELLTFTQGDGWPHFEYKYLKYEDVCDADPENYAWIMCQVLRCDDSVPHIEQKIAATYEYHYTMDNKIVHTHSRSFYDRQYDFNQLVTRVYKLVALGADIHRYIEVEPTSKIVWNAV
jgi:hypothetical protein